MIDTGDTFTMHGGRTLIVTGVADGVVTYLDCYEDGSRVKRQASEVQWEIDEGRSEVQWRVDND